MPTPRRSPENLQKVTSVTDGLVLSAKVTVAGVGNVRGSAMDANVACTRDLIGSVLLFASAIMIILAFGFL
jgi:hypothetical protein